MAAGFATGRDLTAAPGAKTVASPQMEVDSRATRTDAGQPGTVLLAILATPPETSGERTLKRLELARQILGFDFVRVVNVLDVPTFRTNGISIVGKEVLPWVESRAAISAGLAGCDGVVLGYGEIGRAHV